MALTQGYVTHSIGTTSINLGNVVHTSMACTQLRGHIEAVVVARLDRRGKNIVATWRQCTRQVDECKSCPSDFEWEWQDDAKCNGTWPAIDMLTFPTGRSDLPRKLIAEYCEPCPVRVECACFALNDTSGLVGIWGGVLVPPTNRDRPQAIQALRDVAAMLPSSEHAA